MTGIEPFIPDERERRSRVKGHGPPIGQIGIENRMTGMPGE